MSRIKADNILKLKEKNHKNQSGLWPLESDDFYAQMATDTFGSSVSENTFEEKVIIGKAIDCGAIYNN